MGIQTVTVRPPTRTEESGATAWHGEARLDPPLHGVERIWWHLRGPQERGAPPEPVTPATTADAALLAVVPAAMIAGRRIEVRGAPVSAGLLGNVVEAQHAWSQWRGWSHVDIEAEADTSPAPRPGATIAAYSGGVDSGHALWRHLDGDAGHQRRTIDAAVFVGGFDIPLGDPGFETALARIAPPVERRGVPVLALETNLRDLHDDWQAYHGFALASALTFAGGAQRTGMIAATDTYARPVMGWGSNPITDPLLGSDAFSIRHDGCGADRVAKVEALAAWPDLLDALRFCWAGPAFDANCGTCLKCVTMAMIFRVLDLTPACFERPVADETICAVLRASGPSGFTHTYNQPILDRAAERSMTDPWVPLLLRRLRVARLSPALDVLTEPVRRRLPGRGPDPA